jgi:hypothetical protein
VSRKFWKNSGTKAGEKKYTIGFAWGKKRGDFFFFFREEER